VVGKKCGLLDELLDRRLIKLFDVSFSPGDKVQQFPFRILSNALGVVSDLNLV
jgi:hypothetical protein